MTTKQNEAGNEPREHVGETVPEHSTVEAPSDIADLLPGVPTPPGATVIADAKAIKSAEESVASEWEVGNVILDLYEVKDIHSGGAMGVVYRVGHRGWNMDLAVKSPRPDFFATQEQKANFVRECETWIGLGLHPHTVSCHYVRMLGGIPRVFAEYIDGGSLSEWIKTGRLYEGDQDEALERMLDVAIQFDWGLEYAHERGLIHQDIKPANVMMTPEGVAKVTDFGIAQARPMDEVELADGEGGTVLVEGRGMTPAYCSPEQAGGKELSRKTDIWSWGVSLLEMFTGEMTWAGGQVAGAALEAHLDAGVVGENIPPMPAGVVELLRDCFQWDPAERPKDMGAVAARLRNVYREVTGQEYAREEPKAAELLPGGLNNQAVSLLDLGRQKEAEELFERALQSDPHHPEASYNRGLVLWHSGRLTDDALVTQLEEVQTSHESEWRDEYYLGLVHTERGDADAAVALLKKAARAVPENDEVHRALEIAEAGSGKRGTCVRKLEGHEDGVNAVAISADGRWAISASTDTTLRLWELATGNCVRALEGHEEAVNSVAMSPDGRWVLSGSDDKALRLWELRTGECVRVFAGHTEAVNFVGMTRDAAWALSGSKKEKTLRLWELATGRCVRTIPHHGSLLALAISPDGSRAVSGKADWTMRLWEPSTGRMLDRYEHTGKVWAVAVTENGRLALSGCDDGSLRFWDLATGHCIRAFAGHGSGVGSLAVTPDGRYALSGGAGKIRLWQLQTGQCLRTFDNLGWKSTSVDISPDGRWALAGCERGALHLLDLGQDVARAGPVVAIPRSAREVGGAASVFEEAMENARQALNQGQPREAAAAALEAQGLPEYERHPVALEMLREVGLRGRRQGLKHTWCANVLTGHSHGVTCVSISLDGLWALLAGHDEILRLWEMATGRCLRTLEGPTDVIHTATISPNRRWALAGSEDRTLRLWELSNGESVWTVSPFVSDYQGARAEHERGAGGRVYSAAFTPDSRWAATGSEDKKVRLWSVDSGKCVRMFEGHTQEVSSVAITPDGRQVLSGSHDNTLRLWDLATGECVRVFEGPGSVYSVAISPDGRWGLSGGFGDCLRLWNLATAECERVFEGHSRSVGSVAFSPDSAWALSGCWDGTLRLWKLATGECVRKFEGHSGSVDSVAFSHDMRWALSGSYDTTLRLWELVWDYEFPETADWHEGAQPYLQTFLTLHCPYDDDGLGRTGEPSWNDEDFDQLIEDLQHRSYGWLGREGVQRQLEKMSADWLDEG